MIEGVWNEESIRHHGPDPIMSIVGLKKYFVSGLFHKKIVKAVDGLSLEIKSGESFALVGESGCGKSTVGRCVGRLSRPTAGSVYFRGSNVWQEPYRRKIFRKEMQIIFQDPDRSLDPRMKLIDILREPLKVHDVPQCRQAETVAELMAQVNLSPDLMARYPHELSGGQRQRIGIARAFSLNPKLIIADEAGASLDLLAQAQILELMKEKQAESGTAYLYISHNLNAVQRFADRIGVIYLGRCVEIGTTEAIFNSPAHPYTRGLLSAFTGINSLSRGKKLILKGEPPSPMRPPSGCRFHPRCPNAKDICSNLQPPERQIGEHHSVWCHF